MDDPLDRNSRHLRQFDLSMVDTVKNDDGTSTTGEDASLGFDHSSTSLAVNDSADQSKAQIIKRAQSDDSASIGFENESSLELDKSVEFWAHNDSIGCLNCNIDDDDDILKGNTNENRVSNLASEERTKQKRKCKDDAVSSLQKDTVIQFGSVTVIYHATVLGDNSFCIAGPPIALGTKVEREEFDSISDYEESYPKEGEICPTILPVDRRNMLKHAGVSFSQMREVVVKISAERQRRDRDVTKYKKRVEMGERVRQTTRIWKRWPKRIQSQS